MKLRTQVLIGILLACVVGLFAPVLKDARGASSSAYNQISVLVKSSVPTYTDGQTQAATQTTRSGIRHDLDSVGGTAVAAGSSTSAASVPVVIASDQAAVASKIDVRSDELHCYVTTTATTSTQITGCEVQAAKSIYITTACISGDILSATGTPFTLQSGTSTGCTGPHVLWSGWHPALTNYCVSFPSPIKVTVAEGLCILDGTTGSKSAMVSGFVK